MSDSDKIKNKAEELTGRGKETLGAATHDRDLQAEGRADQTEEQPQAGRREDQGRPEVAPARADATDAFLGGRPSHAHAVARHDLGHDHPGSHPPRRTVGS